MPLLEVKSQRMNEAKDGDAVIERKKSIPLDRTWNERLRAVGHREGKWKLTTRGEMGPKNPRSKTN